MATDSATIYREILAQARVAAALAAAGSLTASRVSISPIFSIDGLTTPHIQVILPGEAAIPHDRSGVGLIEEEFRVAIIQQINRDRFKTWTLAVSDSGTSITKTVTAIRGDGLASGASGLHNFVTANAEGPITLLGWGAIQLSDEDPNFIAQIDRYRILYELDSYA